jgi:outer membrane protein TolC
MRIAEVMVAGTGQLDMLKQQAKLAQRRAKEAALRQKLRKTQQALTALTAKPAG